MNIEILRDFFTAPLLLKILNSLVAVVLLYVVYRMVRHYSRKIAAKALSSTAAGILNAVIRYTFLILGILYILGVFGVSLNALLGAAGVAGITIGFAAQTSVSNIISGFFLLSEKVVRVGDYITIGDTSGTVDSIDMLSIKLKTLDNQLVRISNESIIKSNMINFSYFPIRRIAVSVAVSYDTDLQKAMDVLQSVPAKCPLILTEPAPFCLMDSFAESGIVINLFVWFKRENLVAAKNAVFVAVKAAFDEQGITIPFPQIDVHTV
ncbi:MAG: mechanosensitive ion channel family protein [Treponema sp.]|jgi:small-conductance mechanosensitive channel|nr:mechanosensitive ion channel family protein [Treponema sp.]